jgi:hypothetical protein
MLGRSAGHGALAARDVDRTQPSGEQREALDGRVGEHPRILAPAAALARYDGALGPADARQAAGEHVIVAASVRGEEDAHHQGAALDMIVHPHGRVSERQVLL